MILSLSDEREGRPEKNGCNDVDQHKMRCLKGRQPSTIHDGVGIDYPGREERSADVDVGVDAGEGLFLLYINSVRRMNDPRFRIGTIISHTWKLFYIS